jgi:hypothetical protein
MPNPLGEVFGYPPNNFSEQAKTHRSHKLCRFHNVVPECTKDDKDDPLGVCSILDESRETAVICPIRLREDWLIADDAAGFFFPAGSKWETLTEVPLKDRGGESAGKIDYVLVSYDEQGKVIDFGSLEVQTVYISGNIRNPFEDYMKDPKRKAGTDWEGENYPGPDYLSSSRKRLAPQMLYKGGIFRAWKKKQAVALHKCFFATLPELKEVKKERAEVAWLIYDLELDRSVNVYKLVRHKTVYTEFKPALRKIVTTFPGDTEDFVSVLQRKLQKKLATLPF